MKDQLEREFTIEEIQELTYDDCICDDNGNEIFYVVHKETVYFDKEKSSSDVEYVIKEVATGKFYKSELNDSVWIGQDEYNAEQKWHEVKKITKVVETTYYE